ncbi:MAG: hypothetical protein H6629_13255 [Calditrichae bacterium]|nr:hypothetical protein [Calditrichia bacterium]
MKLTNQPMSEISRGLKNWATQKIPTPRKMSHPPGRIRTNETATPMVSISP